MSVPYKKILVIGATSGIGEALATRFVENGSSVIAVGRRQENLDTFCKQHGSKATSIKFDITDLSSIRDFAVKVHDTHPDLDCVLLNSGIQRPFDFSRPETVDLQLLETELTTNYTSYIHLAMAFLPFLQRQSETGPTALMFTTSGLALMPITRCGNYCASKAALHHWILVLREQLKDGPGNVKVVEILPPAVQTELHDEKHQPDMKGGRSFGMPLAEFTDETWKGIEGGEEQIAVGFAANPFKPEGFETKRQEMFHRLVEQTKKTH